MVFVNKVKFGIVLFFLIMIEPVVAADTLSPLRENRVRLNSDNYSPALNINKAVQGGITSPDAATIRSNLSRLQQTPDGSRDVIVASTMRALKRKITNFHDGDIKQNSDLLNAYGSPDKVLQRKAFTYDFVAGYLSPEERRKQAVIDVNHVMTPKIITDKKTGKCKGVSGGHDIQKYSPGEFLSPCYLSQDRMVLAATHTTRSSKTFRHGVDEDSIVANQHNGTVIAYKRNLNATSNLEILQDSHGNLFGTCNKMKPAGQGEYNAWKATQYPLVAVDANQCSLDDFVVVGFLGDLDFNNTTISNCTQLEVSSLDLAIMMQKSPLQTYDRSIAISDITQQVEARFQSDLSSRSYLKNKLPCSIFAIKRNLNKLEDLF